MELSHATGARPGSWLHSGPKNLVTMRLVRHGWAANEFVVETEEKYHLNITEWFIFGIYNGVYIYI